MSSVLFDLSAGLLTKASQAEIFASTVAHAAVLVPSCLWTQARGALILTNNRIDAARRSYSGTTKSFGIAW